MELFLSSFISMETELSITSKKVKGVFCDRAQVTKQHKSALN